MPPKVTDTHTNNADLLHAVAEETAQAARRIVATYADDFFDAVTLMCMLGVEPQQLNYKSIAAEHAEQLAAEEKAKKAKKTSAKKTTKKTTKKATKKAPAKKTTAKKTTKKTTTKKAAAKKTTKKTTS